MVLLQILYHRITGRPLFRAAPLHRWLEAGAGGARSRYFTGCVRSAYAAWRLPCLVR